ncbi:acyl-CoA dehydrogenase family protein [Extensimonas vulgaris]|uniref:Alkylation response protein AidB-like acyl-CoA dehydrogenase n=1 Tax=Extensimonas vulgaris TaxID=1031594 RepID=A0A369AK80_9BURK|nr:acyl-CoA dehydrogenase family protein [Extensimonas vulgaris]RCX08557.1 alkylation response protein AidB-like acyl-CoA dehydrogenase [Extensimonas vulgaris]TWI39853.1 alkylation response protein AidB-like acyl-CoA dehydrogenase [Extensimonas vulgaris]TXD14043.1 acyl-CoA dehydrogenase [Extensimonas vulgaris]
MDFSFTEEQNMLRESVRKMLDRIATPAYVRAMDEEARYPYEVYDAIVEMGLISMVFPEQYGGLGGNVIDFVIIAEELGRKSYDLMGAYGTSVFNGLNLLHNGSEAQKRHYLPKLMSGEIRMSISMTEPDAGSDAGAMRTFARREGDEWVINGQKVFSTGAGAKNNIISLYAKTDNSVHYRKGISLFLVDNTLPGIRLRKLDTLGRRSLGTYEVFFDNVRIPADCIVGEPNRGWDYMLSGLQLERLMTTAAYCGAAQDVVDQALAYAKERKQFGKPIGNFQAIAHMLADMQTDVEASRLLMLHSAWLLAQGKDALKVLSMAKLFGSEAYVRAANNGMQIMGGYGYIKEFDMQRHFRDARVTTITAGTSQVQRNLIAKLMGLDPK